MGAGFAVGCLASVVGVCVVGGGLAWWLASRVGLVTGPTSAGGTGLAGLLRQARTDTPAPAPAPDRRPADAA